MIQPVRLKSTIPMSGARSVVEATTPAASQAEATRTPPTINHRYRFVEVASAAVTQSPMSPVPPPRSTTRELRRAQFRPRVIVDFETAVSPRVDLVVKNVGELPAYGVRLTFTPPLATPREGTQDGDPTQPRC